jgi:hypothetical protein
MATGFDPIGRLELDLRMPGMPGMPAFRLIPSGKRLHNALENDHFSWVNPLFLWPF